MSRSIPLAVGLFCLIQSSSAAPAADWPMWRYNAGRTAVSPQNLPETLHLQWVRHLPPLKPAFSQVRQERLQFDLGYEPVVLGQTIVVGSSRNDSVTAFDTRSGTERWRFYTDGPVRLAPALWNGRAYVASDDGHLYCLSVAEGKLLWRLRAVPSSRKALGNGRLISVWPVRGGPVVADGRVYFAAGVWPFEGIFVYAVDAVSGEVVWVNDRTGCIYATHPHKTLAFGGPSPAGYLLVQGEELIVPSGRAFPARFNRATGELIEFEFGWAGHGSQPGAWFVATGPDGKLVVDRDLNTEMHDEGQQVIGQHAAKRLPDEALEQEVAVGSKTYRVQAGARLQATAGGKRFLFADRLPSVSGTIHSMLAADDRLFVVTREGAICCLGPEPVEPKRYKDTPVGSKSPLSPRGRGVGGEGARPSSQAVDLGGKADGRLRQILDAAPLKAGYAVVLGLGSGRLVKQLVRESAYQVIGLDPDAAKVDRLRRELDDAGLYGERVALHVGRLADAQLPPYLASLVVSDDPEAAEIALVGQGRQEVERILRPDGGTARQEDRLLVRGALKGAADYTGDENRDDLVRAPLGLLWFGDTFHHHKLFYQGIYPESGRGLPTEISVIRGVMKYATTTEPYGPKPAGVPHATFLQNLSATNTFLTTYTDIYTGRVMDAAEAAVIPFPARAAAEVATEAAPPTLPDPRRNPLTGLVEGRAFLKGHGCDRDAVDYGHVLTYRSATAGYYDKRLESGTININGLRSGCRNTIIPAGGVMTLPSWTGNCTCNYPVLTSMAVAPMPESFEQWTAWGGVAQEAPIERVGINFGAPGDRVAADGTLWLDYPSVGGPSPEVPIEVSCQEPEKPEWFYRHSLWMEGGEGPPWVTASGVKAIRSICIRPLVKPAATPAEEFSVRWAGVVRPEFSEPYTIHGQSNRGLRVWLGGRLILDNSQKLRRGEAGEISASVEMKAGQEYPIAVECYPAQGAKPGASVQLLWSSPSVAKALIPPSRLLTAEEKPGGLSAAYFRQGNLSGPAVLTTDAQIDFTWDAKGPAALAPKATGPRERLYTVSLYFAEPDDLRPGQRIFSVSIQGKEVLKDFDVTREAGARNRGVVRRLGPVAVQDLLQITFTPSTAKPPLVCGVCLELAGLNDGGPELASQ